MSTIRVNGTSLYYEEQGAGPGVIFVHGSWSGLNVDLDGLSGYAQPTLLTQGDQSPPLFAPVLDRLQTVLPHAERHTYVAAGHIPHITHPSEFAAVVADNAAR